MRVARQQLEQGELDYELIWLSVSLGSLAFAGAWFALRLPWPHCVFLTLTAHPCLTCGATRSTIAFFHLDFWTAWKWNPLFFIFLCGLSIFDVYAFAVLVLRAPRLRLARLTVVEKNFIRVAAILLLAANWLYLLSRPAGLY